MIEEVFMGITFTALLTAVVFLRILFRRVNELEGAVEVLTYGRTDE